MDTVRSDAPGANTTRAGNPWLPATLMLPTFIAAFATLLLSCDDGRVAPFWPANAVVVALLLQTRPDRWWRGLAAGACGLVFAGVIDGFSEPVPFLLLAGNVLEILICAGLFRRAVREGIDLARPSHLVTFLAAAIAAPAVSAAYAATLLNAARGQAFAPTWLAWYAGDALGLLLVTPVLLLAWRALARRYAA